MIFDDQPMRTAVSMLDRRRITDEKLQRIVRQVVPQVMASADAPPRNLIKQSPEMMEFSVDFYGFFWISMDF